MWYRKNPERFAEFLEKGKEPIGISNNPFPTTEVNMASIDPDFLVGLEKGEPS